VNAKSAEEPEWLRAFATREEHFAHGSAAWTLTLPASSEDLFDAAAFESDERLPYWADLWPSAKRLARWVLDGNVPESHAIELGSGVALVALALRARGAEVTATDYEKDALRFAELNAARNALGPLPTRLFDWRHPPQGLSAPLVIAADVLYEKRNADALAELLPFSPIRAVHGAPTSWIDSPRPAGVSPKRRLAPNQAPPARTSRSCCSNAGRGRT
jgi:predicted nicotinamide N-methyase